VLWYSRDLPDPNRLIDRAVAQTTKLYDRTGQTVLYEIHGAEKRSVVQLADIPLVVQHATIVAEDRDFYSHNGISLRGIVRASLSNLTGIGKGGGGSTLTQQLVKNAILTNKNPYSRKLKEWVLAWRIEKRFTKDQILQLYLNEIPYGGSSYGIQSAAQAYFSKDVGQLTMAEAATLAAITNAPTSLSPYTARGLERLNARKDYVLQGMVDEGYATADEVAAAREQKLAFTPRRDAITAPHFSLWVYQQLVEKYGQRLVEEGGLKVITTLDVDLQKAAEEAVASRVESNATKYQAHNAALVSLDVPTAQVRAMVGSADFFDEDIDGQVNVATAPRQPGSSFKPIAYAAAFDAGYSPQTVLFDLETDFPTDQGLYHPHNYDLKEHGPIKKYWGKCCCKNRRKKN
jgi:penicillin-binding protein 1A